MINTQDKNKLITFFVSSQHKLLETSACIRVELGPYFEIM